MRALYLLPLPLLFAASSAVADVKSACMADYLALCASVPPGGGQVVACMKAHRAQISVTCKVAVLRHIADKKGSTSAEEYP